LPVSSTLLAVLIAVRFGRCFIAGFGSLPTSDAGPIPTYPEFSRMTDQTLETID
jgi:hypothetical protein